MSSRIWTTYLRLLTRHHGAASIGNRVSGFVSAARAALYVATKFELDMIAWSTIGRNSS